jgi:glucose-1-phosphate cytidylyltransferase
MVSTLTGDQGASYESSDPCGWFGHRLSEETDCHPVEIGGKPILWHMMKIYSAHEINDFIVCLSHKVYVIKEWFANRFLRNFDVTIDMRDNSMSVHQASVEPWRVPLVDTGEATMIGGRIKRILPLVAEDPAFCLTYADGVGGIDVSAAMALHRRAWPRLRQRGRPGGLFLCTSRGTGSTALVKAGVRRWLDQWRFLCSFAVS